MLTKINETVMIVIGAAFALFAIWNFSVPIDQAVVEQLWSIVIAILGSLGIGAGSMLKSVNNQADKAGVVETNKFKLNKQD